MLGHYDLQRARTHLVFQCIMTLVPNCGSEQVAMRGNGWLGERSAEPGLGIARDHM